MKLHLMTAIGAAALLASTCAHAQVGLVDPLATSPMSVGPNTSIGTGLSTGSGTSVGPVGIPLGAMELAAPGISPPPMASSCSTGGTPGVPPATALFDGGGMAGALPTACAPGGNTAGYMPNAGGSNSTPPALSAGRAGIPLGSTEIASPGLSPMPPTTILLAPTPSSPSLLATSPAATGMGSPPAPLEPPCPVTGTFTSQATVRQSRGGASNTATFSPGC